MSGCTDTNQDPTNKQLTGIFQMPGTIKDYKSDIQGDIDHFKNQKSILESCSTSDDSPKEIRVFGNKKCSAELVIGQGLQKIKKLEANHFFNFAQQELAIYSSSMQQYQCNPAFEYYLGTKVQEYSKILFKDLTIENYIFETVLTPVMQVFRQTSEQFLNQYLMRDGPEYCQLQDQLSLLHKVYFLQGVSMHKFLA